MKYIIIFLSSLILSLILTPIVKKVTTRLGIVNKPKDTRWKHEPVALMGGIAIFVSFFLAILLIANPKKEIIALLAGGGSMFALGFLDDVYGTNSKVKFAFQIVIAFTVVYLGIVSKITPYFWLDVSLTILWIVGLTNAFNLLDNMDGLSSGVAIIAVLGIFGLSLLNGQTTIALMCLALAGSCLGFLRYNFNPAKIFMGDCGSQFLGYMLATLAVFGGWQHNSPIASTFLSPVLVLGVAIFDTTLVTILRLLHGKMPWQGGKDHSSHRLVSILGGNEKRTVLVLYGIGIFAGVLGLIVVELSSFWAIIITLAFSVGMVILGVRLSKVECY
jgi:UDP-GlcNAc:undecaprenyl-phosphate/decaprenyl-phosphate GlcNAc-1-phosphate transferase